MIALQVYPPMGKRRVQYFLPSGDADPQVQSRGVSTTKSFGRYQLIQAYIFAKTGKTRTRKQVSSHMQRFKKLNSNNPLGLQSTRTLQSQD